MFHVLLALGTTTVHATRPVPSNGLDVRGRRSRRSLIPTSHNNWERGYVISLNANVSIVI